MTLVQLPTELYTQIIQQALLVHTETYSSLSLSSKYFYEILNSNPCLAAHYYGVYGASVYYMIMKYHPKDFTPEILGNIESLSGTDIPNGVLHSFKQQSIQNRETLDYLGKKCTNVDDSQEFLNLFMSYVSATKREGGIPDRTEFIKVLKAFLKKTRFILAYMPTTRVYHVLECLPVCMFEEALDLAMYICVNSGLDKEEINSKMCAKIMWDYGYLKEWSNTKEKNEKVDKILQVSGFSLKGKAVEDIIRRNTWVNWCSDLEDRVGRDAIEKSAKVVIEEHLKKQNGGGYMVAMRLAKTYDIPFAFVDRTYQKYFSFV